MTVCDARLNVRLVHPCVLRARSFSDDVEERRTQHCIYLSARGRDCNGTTKNMAARLLSLRPESMRQEVQALELVLHCVLAESELPPTSEMIDLNVCDTRISMQAAGTNPMSVTFIKPIRSSEAVAKFSRKRRRLTFRAPILDESDVARSSPVHSLHSSPNQYMRATVGSLLRGEHVIEYCDNALEAGTDCYVLISRAEDFAEIGRGGYTWCHTYKSAPGARVAISIAASDWVWECADALLTFGVLKEGHEKPRIEPGLEQVGVAFSERGVAHAETLADLPTARCSHEYVPDEARLPSAALQRSCRLYYSAFAAVDGYELSGAYVRSRPPPPKWLDSAAPAGEIVDTHYSSLTYGEAEFVPLYQLLTSVGVPAEGVVVDVGSGSGRMVLCSSLGFPGLREVRGIELVPELRCAAVRFGRQHLMHGRPSARKARRQGRGGG